MISGIPSHISTSYVSGKTMVQPVGDDLLPARSLGGVLCRKRFAHVGGQFAIMQGKPRI